MCTVIHAIHVGGHDILVMLHLTVEKAALRPWDARICNEDIEATIELFDNLIDDFFDVILASNIDLICSA